MDRSLWQEVKHALGWNHPCRTNQAPKTEDGRQDGQVDLQAHSWGSCIWSNLRGSWACLTMPEDVTQVYYLMTSSD